MEGRVFLNLHHQVTVNQVLFVVTPLLCLEILKHDLEWGPSHSTTRTTYATTQLSQPSSVYGDTTTVPRAPQTRLQVGTGRRLRRKRANARGTPFVSERVDSSIQVSPLLGHKGPYSSASFAAVYGGNKRPTTGFGVYFDPTTGT
ncbi:uncharacterized protein LOC129875422 isoform X2 [Solanum dulcamara]|nr:uncharacterized protein LOC129875422 isoform X2 [Solanum dulcamara]